MLDGQKWLRYAIGGLLIGGFWYFNRSRPPWEEALRTIVVFTILILVLRARLRRRANIHAIPLIVSKAALVVFAAIVEQEMIDRSVRQASLITSVGLVVVVCVLGAVGDRHFFGSTAESTGH